ncbi:MAG: phage portal protein [Candidatus Heimdallarchaeaceae archaeon]
MSIVSSLLNVVERRLGTRKGYINENFPPVIFTPYGTPPSVSYETLWAYVKSSPEVISLISTIVDDILSDGWHLEGGRNNVKKAEQFLENNFMKQLLYQFLFDAFCTGDAYIYKVGLTDEQIRDVVNVVSGRSNISIKSEDIIEEIKGDEDIFSTRELRLLASSTMRMKWDEHGDVYQYIQKVPNIPKPAYFTPEEIIHFRLMSLDGKLYGFTPLRTILNEMDILANIKDLARYQFSNGGVPNFMFILKGETPNSETYKNTHKALQLYASIRNRYKNPIICTKKEGMEVVQLNRLKDMEFKELATYVTKVLIMVWGVPPTRLGGIISEKGQTNAIEATEGYYRKISHYQDILEDLLNSQLLHQFKVKLRFNKTYRQDEVREVAAIQIKTDICERLLKLGLVNNDFCWNLLRIKDIYRGEGYNKDYVSGTDGKLQPSITNIMSSVSKQTDNNLKQERALRRSI